MRNHPDKGSCPKRCDLATVSPIRPSLPENIFVRFWLWRHFTSELTMTDSQQLLEEYARSGSESAFRELVTRYLGLVYSTALRLVGGDIHLAEDVAQTVFMDLARK